jgi:hypothetical protein
MGQHSIWSTAAFFVPKFLTYLVSILSHFVQLLKSKLDEAAIAVYYK